MITILTPTYNRAYILRNAYASLLSNKKEEFEWIIVDDGSSDETRTLVESWITENKINIHYLHQENQGKTNALVTGIAHAVGKFTLVLDSDDILSDRIIDELAVEIGKLEAGIVGIVGLKTDLMCNLIGSDFKSEYADYAELYFGINRTSGDKLFLVNTDVYKKSLVKSYPGEKLIPESVFYINMSQYGKFKCMNKVFYSGNYLSDGLSDDIIKLAARNIQGFILEKKMLQTQNIALKEKILNEIKYIAYSASANLNFFEIVKNSSQKRLTLCMYIPALLFTSKRIQKIKNARNVII